MKKPFWLLRQMLRGIGASVVAYAALALAAAVLPRFADPLVPDAWEYVLPADAVQQILDILASSMLAVTTFSLSIAVSAFAAASSTATPRSADILQRDPITRNVLATFLGAFLFSLVGVIGLQAGLYGTVGRLVLFVSACVVVAIVVVSLLRWISHLMTFGRMNDTLERVEKVASDALRARCDAPFLGGQPLDGAVPADAQRILANTIGYVQHIDMARLSACAESAGCRFWIAALPGAFVHHGSVLLHYDGGEVDDDHVKQIRSAFTCASTRNFDQDPRFGVIVLAEIASRALSPAVNDPGSAIAVIGRLVRVLADWDRPVPGRIDHPRVHVRGLAAADLVEDAFRPIARDGAAMVEVQIRLHKALAALAAMRPDTFGDAAGAMSALAFARSHHIGLPDCDLAQIRDHVINPA